MLMIKNLTKEILKNKVFLALLFIITVCSSFMFFFIRFSIDANLAFLESLNALSQNQQNYLRALNSNSYLAITVLFSIASVASLIFALFFFRFYSSAKKQIGILKAVGYRNISFQVYFCLFAVIFSIFGLCLGMLLGYFGSSIHLAANAQSYGVSGLKKGVNFIGVVLGLGVPILMFGITMFLCGFILYKKDNISFLNSSTQNAKQSKLLKFADSCAKKLPFKNKAPIRIALRKPISCIIIIIASMVFTVMLVLGWSLTASGESIYKSQIVGHSYNYESVFNEVQSSQPFNTAIYSLNFNGLIKSGNAEIEQRIMGMDFKNEIYSLQNLKGENLSELKDNNCYITEELSEMYKLKIGEEIIVKICDKEIKAKIQNIAFNAKLKTIIFNRIFIAEQMGLLESSFNGCLSLENVFPNADKVVDKAMKVDELNRNKVSSQVSAVINQAIGALSGVVLMFLALFIVFQDNTRDMMILKNLGKDNKEIMKLFINIFLPILIIGFIISAFPAVLIAKAVQSSLSLQTGDYMPFSTNILVLLVGLIAVIAIYFLVRAIFSLAIKRMLKKKSILQYTNEL